MTNKDIPTRINIKEQEEEIYRFWLEKKYFHADENSTKPPYSIVIPPPNVTGSLHMGHALNNTLQDILARFHRLKGFEVLWLPGTDHAGIATQNVVEKMLAKEGVTRQQIGRDEFIKLVWKWKEESGGKIIHQLKRLGASCDWERERFTLDEGLSKAVRKVFVDLYKEGLIYRGNYIVNWCPRCHTALSDLEVEHEEQESFLYYILYPIKGLDEQICIATSRPETMLGDTAVAVHPEDERYKHLIGKVAILPILNREIPIIADEYVDREFGTGALKVTPAHDPNDFQLGIKHNLEQINILTDSGEINENGGKYSGLDRFVARERIVEELTQLGLFVKKEPLVHNVGSCYRCKTVVEPKNSMQWFVKVKPLAEEAIKVVKEKNIQIFPEIWEKTYFEWMSNIKDWCVSRQIWWGHRIPAWYCNECEHITVSFEDPSECEKCCSRSLTQEADVLDTWFSSALWPFSTMGWPEMTKTLQKFYPTSCLVTGFDILFFWVARMIMMGMKFMKKEPFKHVYIHALVRDQYGQKMSKSKGNVIDPLVVIDEYGADAFRFTLAAFAAQGRDIKLSEDRIEGYYTFVNKIWNASRFIFINSEEDEYKTIDSYHLEDEDKWILQELKQTALDVEKFIKSYDFNEAAGNIYHFFWNKFCDWYIEFIKDRIFGDNNKEAAIATARFVLYNSLIILHPFMPFITEYIYRFIGKKESILIENYPEIQGSYDKEYNNIEKVIELISKIRNIRGEYNVSFSKSIEVFINALDDSVKEIFTENENLIKRIGKVSKITFIKGDIENAAVNITKDYKIFIPLGGLIDIDAEIKRLEKERIGLEKDYKIFGGKLSNENYLRKAPLEVIEKDKQKFEEISVKLEEIKKSIERLKKLC
jgi:valyl-tRNA synthetase